MGAGIAHCSKIKGADGRGVETVGPAGPVGHIHLRSDSSTILPAQMSERALKHLKCFLCDISACIGHKSMTYQITLEFYNISISTPI